MTRAPALAAAIFAIGAAPAGAVDFGATDLTQAVTEGCPAYPCSVTNEVHADGTAETGSPIDGILTSVRLGYAGDGADAVLRVLRPGAAGAFLNDGPEIEWTLPASAGEVFALDVRRPIEAGDRLGLGAGDSFSGDLFLAAEPPRECLRGGAHPAGTSEPYAPCSGELLVQGTVEPDEDADGYGDESQDGCPTDAAISDSACSADLSLEESVEPETVMLFEPVTFTMSIFNRGSSPAEDVGLKVPVDSKAQLGSTKTTAGRCGGVRAVFCWLGTVAPGETATVRVTVIAAAPGTLSIRSGVTSSTLDPNVADDLASARVTVVDPFAGVGLREQTVRARRGFAHVLHSCPRVTLRYCQGVVALTRASGDARLGRARFQLQPGAESRIPVKLSKKALGLLAKRRRLELVVTTQGQNGAGTKRTTSAPLVVLAAKRKP